MNKFKPTYLYIKQHTVTGKLYFGKTTRNPEKYLGSGVRWKNHITAHGKEFVATLWYCLFLDNKTITKFAMMCSKQWGIVDSDVWLNLKEENGNDGGTIGSHISDETKAKLSKYRKGQTPWIAGKNHSEESKKKIGLAQSGKPKKQYVCPHCGKIGRGANMSRYHFENCKLLS